MHVTCGNFSPRAFTTVPAKCFLESDPYCIVKCEGKKIESEVVSDTLSPEWASAEAVFYRKNPEKPIKVQVHHGFH